MIAELKKIPNQVTLLRLLLIPVLWYLAIAQQHTIFGALFTLAGLTDALDGFLARHFNQTSEFGAHFDSLADNILLVSLPAWLWLLLPAFVMDNLLIIGGLFTLFLLSILLGFIKYNAMIAYHTYLNKAATVLFFVFIAHALFFQPNNTLFFITAVNIFLATLEEIAITLSSKRMETDRLSIFRKNL